MFPLRTQPSEPSFKSYVMKKETLSAFHSFTGERCSFFQSYIVTLAFILRTSALSSEMAWISNSHLGNPHPMLPQFTLSLKAKGKNLLERSLRFSRFLSIIHPILKRIFLFSSSHQSLPKRLLPKPFITFFFFFFSLTQTMVFWAFLSPCSAICPSYVSYS